MTVLQRYAQHAVMNSWPVWTRQRLWSPWWIARRRCRWTGH